MLHVDKMPVEFALAKDIINLLFCKRKPMQSHNGSLIFPIKTVCEHFLSHKDRVQIRS